VQIGPKSLARALEVKQRVDAVSEEIRKRDNVPGVDLDSRSGEVVVSLSSGRSAIEIPVPGGAFAQYQDEVQQAAVSFDPASGKIRSAALDCAQFYNSSYGRSAEDLLHYQVETKTENGKPVLV